MHSSEALSRIWGLDEDASEVLSELEVFVLTGDRARLRVLLKVLSSMISMCDDASTSSVQETRPLYYGREDGIEVIDIIEDWRLGFHLGNVLKYLVRAGKKGSKISDLKKARWYAERFLAKIDPAPRCI